MFHLIKNKSTSKWAVANVADNGRYVGGNGNFNNRQIAYNNMWAQIDSAVYPQPTYHNVEEIFFQDDSLEIPVLYSLTRELKVTKLPNKPRKKYLLKRVAKHK